jgi:hypothetical protein
MFDTRIFYLQLSYGHRSRRHIAAAGEKRVHRLPDRRQARPEVRG